MSSIKNLRNPVLIMAWGGVGRPYSYWGASLVYIMTIGSPAMVYRVGKERNQIYYSSKKQERKKVLDPKYNRK
uniref:Uncharacterized protein n=1 Tax=Nelumbo nucifera TaxID=4432 RepID=A0A822XPP6_NELNU|nr:TPA_asm: hypothetical protein HUJ06_023485 [Nelumbo nucifera]